MDELDAEIIRLLQSDARLSNRELARRLGTAPSTCLERVRALTRRGVIRGYHAEIDLTALNRGVQALIAVQVRPLRRSVIDDFKDSVGKLPEVMTVFVIAGGDDFLLHVAVQDLDHLHAFLLDRLSKRGEIIGFRTSVIYQRVHNTVLTRLPAGEHATANGIHLTGALVRAGPGPHEGVIGEMAQHRLDTPVVPCLHSVARESRYLLLFHWKFNDLRTTCGLSSPLTLIFSGFNEIQANE